MKGSEREPKRGYYERFLRVFGDLKVFPHPMFVVYDPKSYAVRADEIRVLLACVEPGDILVRGYRNYLDGCFIPGFFTHVGLYVGDVEEADRVHVPAAGSAAFHPGPQRVVHSMAEGVFMEDLLQFARCDSLVVLRLPDELRAKALHGQDASKALGRKGHRDLDSDERAILEALERGSTVERNRVVPVVRRRALSFLGTPYDFQFDFRNHQTLSCTELVHDALRCVEPFHALAPAERNVLGVLRRSILEPDRFFEIEGLRRVMVTTAIPEKVRRELRLATRGGHQEPRLTLVAADGTHGGPSWRPARR